MTGGDITEITFNHPTLGSGVIYPKASEDNSYDFGNFRSDDDNAAIAGNGEMIDKMNRKRWFLKTVIAWDMNLAQDLEKLVALASSPVQSDWTFTHINGTIYGGKGKPVGDLTGNGNTATFPLTIAGGSILKQ